MNEKIIDKIRKLAALSKSSNEHEAALAAARMQELLFKHNLDMSAIETKEEESDYLRSDYQTGRDTWRQVLMNVICVNNFCQAVKLREKGEVAIVGKPHNVEVVQFMYEYLNRELVRLADRGWERQQVMDIYEDGQKHSSRRWKNSFYWGANNIIAQRLKAQRRQDEEVSPEAGALVLVTGRELVLATKDLIGRTGNTRRRATVYNDGYAAGQEAGRNIGLHQGLGGREANPQGRLALGN